MKVCVCEEVRTAEKEKKEQWRREKEREERERVGGRKGGKDPFSSTYAKELQFDITQRCMEGH